MTADPRPPETSETREPAGEQAAVIPAQLDLSTVEGDWISVTEFPFGVSRVHAHRIGETLAVRAYGAGGPAGGDWGTAAANGVFVMQSGAGVVYTAEFENETVRSRLQSYRALGVLAVHVFHRFTDASGRRDFFTREHYVRANGRREPKVATGDVFPAALLTGDHDASELLGTWHPVDPPAKTIAALDFEPAGGGGVLVRAHGVGADVQGDWGAVPAQLYTDGAAPDGAPAILTTFDRGDRLVHLEIRKYLGILVVGEYIEFTDGSGRSDFFVRECYVSG